MKRRVLVDTGPLVAILSSADEFHETCVRTLNQLPSPLYSCWPVINEAAWLLRSYPQAVRRLLKNCGSVNPAFLELLSLSGSEAGEIAEVIEQYHKLRPQLADAALVYLAEREGINTIFTLDRRDFSVYRGARHGAFRIIP
jgi:predicted nucleic acid-binding protein